MKVKVIKSITSVQDGKPVVHLLCRSEDKQRVRLTVTGVRPYFYLDQKPMPHESILNANKEGLDLHNNPLWRVTVKMPTDVPDVRRRYPLHFEADVHFNDRVRYDLGIKSIIEVPDDTTTLVPADIVESDGYIVPRYWNIDIETSDEHGFADPKHPTGEVLSISIYDTYNKTMYAIISKPVDEAKIRKYLASKKWLQKHIGTDKPVKPYRGKLEIFCVKDEYRLYLKIMELYKRLQPDYLLGWNVINYDEAYLRERAGTHSKRIVNKKRFTYPCPDFDEMGVFDLMEGFKYLYKTKHGELESKKLEFVATKELGYGKLKHDGGFFELYNTDPEKFLAYNIWDTVVSQRINKVRSVFFYFRNLVEQAGTTIDKWMHESMLIDSLILHRFNKIVVMPSRANLEGGKDVRGGYVHDPISGILHWVVVIDFKQQYPGAIRSNNMSPETRVDKSYKGPVYTAPSGNLYKKEPRGLLPMLLDELSETRDAIKAKMREHDINSREYKSLDAQQTAFKFFMNSFYGVMATKKAIFRLTDNEVGYDIPDTARKLTQYTIALLEEKGIEVVYGDTDSCLIRFPGIDDPEKVLVKTKQVQKWLNKKYDEFAANMGNTGEPHYFQIEAEVIYETYFQSARIEKGKKVGKKRYAGLMAWKDGEWLTDKKPEDRLVIKGYEVRRSSSSFFTRALQKEVLMRILKGKPVTNIRNLIRGAINTIRSSDFGAEVGIPTGLQKEKPGNEIHARAARFSNKHLGYNFQYGDKPIWFYGYIQGKPKTDVFAIDWGDDLPPNAVVDKEQMIRRCVKGPLEPIISGLGYTWSELITSEKIQKQKKLFG